MEGIVKALYKNCDDKLSCLCLIQKDMKAVVSSHMRSTTPWLSEDQLETKAEILLRTCYEEYKNEKKQKVNIIRRSFRKVVNKHRSCKCHSGKINIESSKDKSKYSDLEEPVDDDRCKCHVTCSERYEPHNFLAPLEKFIVMNRSYKLRLKHLNSQRYGHLNTESPNHRHSHLDEIARSEAPNGSFQVKFENTSTPITRVPRHRCQSPIANSVEKAECCCTNKKVCVNNQGLMNDTYIGESSRKENICDNTKTRGSSLKTEAQHTTDNYVKKTGCLRKNTWGCEKENVPDNKQDSLDETNSSRNEYGCDEAWGLTWKTEVQQTAEKYVEKAERLSNHTCGREKGNFPDNNQESIDDTYIRKSSRKENICDNNEESRKTEAPISGIVINLMHCDSHCIFCTLTKKKQVEPQVVYCENRCQGECSSKALTDETTSVSTELKPSSKLETKIPIKKTKPPVSAILGNYIDNHTPPKRSLALHSIENHTPAKESPVSQQQDNQTIVSDGIDFLEKNVEQFDSSDYIEWETVNLKLMEPSKLKKKIKKKTKWSNTPRILQSITNNHLKPLKKDLHDIQEDFHVLAEAFKST